MEPVLSILLASAANAMSQVMLKMAMTGQGPERRRRDGALRILLSPYLWAGIGLFAVSLSLYLSSIRRLDITVAFPAMGLTLVFVLVLSRLLLREVVDGWKVAGMAAILFGALLVAAGGAA